MKKYLELFRSYIGRANASNARAIIINLGNILDDLQGLSMIYLWQNNTLYNPNNTVLMALQDLKHDYIDDRKCHNTQILCRYGYRPQSSEAVQLIGRCRQKDHKLGTKRICLYHSGTVRRAYFSMY